MSNPRSQAFATQRPAKRPRGLAAPQAAAAPDAALRPNEASQAMAGSGFFDFSQLLAASAVRGHLPLYQKMAASLRAAIRSGTLQTGSGVPPERELALLLGVSRVTVRRAIEELVQDGLLQARQGSGTSVSGRVEQALSALGSFSEDMVRRGYVPGSRWISKRCASMGCSLSGRSSVCAPRW